MKIIDMVTLLNQECEKHSSHFVDREPVGVSKKLTIELIHGISVNFFFTTFGNGQLNVLGTLSNRDHVRNYYQETCSSKVTPTLGFLFNRFKIMWIAETMTDVLKDGIITKDTGELIASSDFPQLILLSNSLASLNENTPDQPIPGINLSMGAIANLDIEVFKK